MIGTAGAILLLGTGRIMGASGILGSLIDGSARGTERLEKLGFLVGLIGMPALAVVIFGAPETNLTVNAGLVVLAGLLVGIGTRLGNGCTSGHGVCGISRLSLRAIVATVLFLCAGMATVGLLRHGLGVI